MSEKQFIAWATAKGLPNPHAEELVRFAATPEEMNEAAEAMELGPPIYTPGSIVSMADEDPFGLNLAAHGLLIVGGCGNGDPIALDISNAIGSVWYLDHETMHGRPLRDAAVRVADNLADFFERMARGKMAWDYSTAKQAARKSP